MPMRLIAAIVIMLLGVFALGCSDDPVGAPQSDSEGPRLAVLSPGFAATLIDLGYADAIVARHGFDILLPESVPVAGDMSGFDYEVLAGVHPTHIILEENAQQIPARLSVMADERSWEIIRMPALTLGDIRASIGRLDRLASGADSMSESAVRLTERFEELGRSATLEAPPGVLLVTWTDPIGVMGPGSFHHELAQAVGLEPLPEDGSPYITLSVEDLIELDPAGILLIMPGASESDAASLLPVQVRDRLRAVREGAVWVENDATALLASTRLLGVARRMEAIRSELSE